MIIDKQNQKPPSLLGIVWKKTIVISEILFLVGILLVSLNTVVEIVAIVGSVGKHYPVPPWIWAELCVLAYPLAPLSWMRILSTWSMNTFGIARRNQYICILSGSFIAFLLALNPATWYSYGSFPLLSVVYFFQLMLDGSLLQREEHTQHSYRGSNLSSHLQREKRVSVSLASQEKFPYKRGTRTAIQAQKTESIISPSLAQCVGIWYSNADRKFAQRLRTHLRPDIRDAKIELWDPDSILAGSIWQTERMRAVRSAAVAVVLISADLLECDFVATKELRHLLYRAQCQRTVVLLLHIKSCNFLGTGLEIFKAVNSPDKPLAQLGTAERDQVFTEVTTIIRQRLGLS